MLARIQCPACGTEQERTEEGSPGCAICGTRLATGEIVETGAGFPAVRDEPPEIEHEPAADLEIGPDDEGSAAAHAATLPEQAPATRPAEVDEILASEKRTTAILAFFPIWGLWRVWRSDLHSVPEKLVYSLLSILTTAGLVAAVWTSIPTDAERAVDLRGTVTAQVERIAALVEQYRTEYGAYPDPETWKKSSSRSDSRFLDPWGDPYVYLPDRGGYALGTYGRDGKPGGEGVDGDIILHYPSVSR